MNEPIGILINGRAGAGKDEIAAYLVNNYGFKKIGFADPIYDAAYGWFDMEKKDRKLLQAIGQKMREIKKNVWINIAFKRAKEYTRVVISDVRQENEYRHGVENGFVPIRVSSDLPTRIERCWLRDGVEPDVSLFENDSETGADDFEYIEIINNGTIEDLHRKVDKVLAQIAGLSLDGNYISGRLWNNQVGE